MIHGSMLGHNDDMHSAAFVSSLPGDKCAMPLCRLQGHKLDCHRATIYTICRLDHAPLAASAQACALVISKSFSSYIKVARPAALAH